MVPVTIPPFLGLPPRIDTRKADAASDRCGHPLGLGEAPVTCREFASFISDYLIGELPRADRLAFVRHLAACPDCERYLGQYRETIAAGRAAFADPDGALPPEVPEELVRAILATRQRAQK
jgi:anti-sigma factor RsiW